MMLKYVCKQCINNLFNTTDSSDRKAVVVCLYVRLFGLLDFFSEGRGVHCDGSVIVLPALCFRLVLTKH